MRMSIVSDGAGWILDEIAKDFKKHTQHSIVRVQDDPDLIWCVNFWSIESVFGKKNVISHLHHVNRDKISQYNFDFLNKTRLCLVPNRLTESFAKTVVSTEVKRMPYWLLSERMKPRDVRNGIRDSDNQVIIGSFQKDGESKTANPKLIKGPDIFIKVVSELNKHLPIKVVLAGYDRLYVKRMLTDLKINYVCFERDNDLNSLYDSLDWYFVTSREEGGPQAVLEASYRKVNILSTPVGIAPEVLDKDCLCNDVDDFVKKVLDGQNCVDKNYAAVQKYLPMNLIPQYDKLFKGICDE